LKKWIIEKMRGSFSTVSLCGLENFVNFQNKKIKIIPKTNMPRIVKYVILIHAGMATFFLLIVVSKI